MTQINMKEFLRKTEEIIWPIWAPIEDSPLQKFLDNLKGSMKRLFDKLCDNFQWADLLDSAMYEGKNFAISLCVIFTSSEDVCNRFVEGIINSLNSE